ncbi:MAG: hypothetical protein KUG57_08900 [Ilumatobacteraceae bacterium]|nr:hypothetical protein [Ilumatobacteraceae bacterium]
MRQILSWRFLAAVTALVGLALVAAALLADSDSLEDAVEPDAIARRMDIIEPIFAADQSAGFRVGRDGVTHGFMDLIVDSERVVRIAPGTLGEIACEELDQINKCALFADMLGDAVVWFAILPQAPRATVELPEIVDLEDGYAVFKNGWEVLYPPVIERSCGSEDIPTFTDFLRRFGPGSISTVDLETRQVVSVRCGEET